MDTESRAYRLWRRYMNHQKRLRPEEEFSAGYITIGMLEIMHHEDGLDTPISGDATTCKKAWVG